MPLLDMSPTLFGQPYLLPKTDTTVWSELKVGILASFRREQEKLSAPV